MGRGSRNDESEQRHNNRLAGQLYVYVLFVNRNRRLPATDMQLAAILLHAFRPSLRSPLRDGSKN